MFPEITATVLGEKLRSDENFVLLDVRELSELDHAKITDSRLQVTPMSRLAQGGVKVLPESIQSQKIPVYIICHHGIRSMQVAGWLKQNGFENIFNVSGGIDAYARKVDPSIGLY